MVVRGPLAGSRSGWPRRGRRAEGRPVPSAAMFERTALPAGPRVISARLPGAAFGLDRRLRPRRVAPRDARGQAGVAHFMEHITFKGTTALPVDPGDLRGDRGRRRLVQRRDRPRIDRLLGPRPAPRGDPGDGRPRRADRPAATSTRPRSTSERAVIVEEIRSYLDDPAEYAQILFQQAMFGDGALGREICGDEDGIRALPPRRSATSGGRCTGRPTRSSRWPATSTTSRRSSSPRRAFGTRQRGVPGFAPAPALPAGDRASCRGTPRHEPGPADPRRPGAPPRPSRTPGSSRS